MKTKLNRTFNRCPLNCIIKDLIDFHKNYDKLKEKVFYRERGDKVYIKIAHPANSKEVKEILFKIKD